MDDTSDILILQSISEESTCLDSFLNLISLAIAFFKIRNQWINVVFS